MKRIMKTFAASALGLFMVAPALAAPALTPAEQSTLREFNDHAACMSGKDAEYQAVLRDIFRMGFSPWPNPVLVANYIISRDCLRELDIDGADLNARLSVLQEKYGPSVLKR